VSGVVIVPFFLNQRGCPHQCCFCAQDTINGHAGTPPSAAEIRATVAAYRVSAGERRMEIAFYGGSFTCLPQDLQHELLHTAAELRRVGTISGIRISTRPDAIGPEAVALLADYGVATVELGVQSMHDGVLLAAGRGHGSAVVAPAVAALKSAGCRVGIQIMPGLPDDTPERALATIQSVLQLQPAFIRIYPTVVVQGAPLAAAYAAGTYVPWTLDLTIATVKQMLHAAMRAAIPVARIGLQDSPSLAKPGAVLAGPHHPALGELVQSALWRDLLLHLIAGCKSGPLEVRCQPQRISVVVGQKRSTITWLSTVTGIASIRVIGDPHCLPTHVVLTAPGIERSGDLLKDVHYD
jgi:histone acetyltransferase (RNA polymerase elongator complex component)